MLSEISSSFAAQVFVGSAFSPWLIGVLCVIVVLLLALFLKSRKAKQHHYIPYGNIEDPKQIKNLIRAAIDQRSAFDVQPDSEDGTKRPTLRCTPLTMTRDHVIIEITSIRSLSDYWIGRAVHVYFRVKVDGFSTYLTCKSTIEGVRNRGQNLAEVDIAIPAVLENRQKRAFLRLTPPLDLVRGGALWCEQDMPIAHQLDDINDWADPTLLLLPGKFEQFHILNLSAGGMRVFVPRQTLRETPLAFHSVGQVLLLMDLIDPDAQKRLRVWLQCRIQNLWEEQTTHDLYVGLQFIAWAKGKKGTTMADTPGRLDWFKISLNSEVECIGNWIMRRHLELLRELPKRQD